MLSRRTFLLTSIGAAGLAACAKVPAPSTPTRSASTPDQPAAVDDDAARRESVGHDESVLIATYQAVLAKHPDLDVDLEPILAAHEAHHLAVAGSGTSLQAEPVAESKVPDTPDAAVAWLGKKERRATDHRAQACDGASDSTLAATLCLIAASEAQHVQALENLRDRPEQ